KQKKDEEEGRAGVSSPSPILQSFSLQERRGTSRRFLLHVFCDLGIGMDHSALCSVFGLSIILLTRHAVNATPVILNDSVEGSGQWESEIRELTPTPSNPSFLNESVKSTSKPFLNQVVDFLQQNYLPIIVISTLVLLTMTVLCSAAILSRRRKVSTYYPCAFPSKMYVDERDKTGGGHLFSEVPEKTMGICSEEPVNSAKQLQEDIMLATKNLRTPVKSPWKDKDETSKEQKPANDEEQAKRIQEKNWDSPEDNATKESSVEKISPNRSQDSLSSSGMEKTDPEESGPPEESKHPSSLENLKIQEDTLKQEAANSGSAFISEEKTAF
ncbi:hypothetical protein DNTS_022094, partial [Danionella cerebrum]